jgi:hypothetical protein
MNRPTTSAVAAQRNHGEYRAVSPDLLVSPSRPPGTSASQPAPTPRWRYLGRFAPPAAKSRSATSPTLGAPCFAAVVRHREILLLLEQGMTVAGSSSSMGALEG